ncbi:hypothetical protein [Nonomuraea basaltis]|uniref:hypothetical protein n=1 Tax=Nonomuraea basaltis TaxID=2495887 RepID=UPI0014867A34|nr:hypothetical protein [Nonomuraea basaltis]
MPNARPVTFHDGPRQRAALGRIEVVEQALGDDQRRSVARDLLEPLQVGDR